jgi:FecR protein
MTLLPRFSALIFFFLLWCGLASGCREAVTRQVTARVLSIHGPVTFATDERTDFRPITLESRLPVGSSVRAFDGSWLDLALLPGVLLRLSSNSEIKIEELAISKNGNQPDGGMRSRSALVQLNRGEIIVLFHRPDKSASQFGVGVRQVRITADSDCLFRVRDDKATTRLTCVQGKVSAAYGSQPPVTIGAGYFQRWPQDRPEPVAATDDAAAQIDIVDSLGIANQLLELWSTWQNRRPFEPIH